VLMFGVWCFVLPYFLGLLAALDRSGRSLSLGNAAIGLALMAGPFLGGLIIGAGVVSPPIETYYPILQLGGAMLITSCLFLVPLLARFRAQ